MVKIFLFSIAFITLSSFTMERTYKRSGSQINIRTGTTSETDFTFGEKCILKLPNESEEYYIFIMGTCVSRWNVQSLNDAQKNKPLIFKRAEVQQYYQRLLETKKQKNTLLMRFTASLTSLLEKKSSVLDEPFYIVTTSQAPYAKRICVHPSWISKIPHKSTIS